MKLLLEQCLQSVLLASKNISTEIFVVDNASADGSEAYFNNKFDGVKFRWSKENLGFSKANNSVLPETKGDYILFLNPDTIVPEDCFEKCMHFLHAHPECGGLGVKMMNAKGVYLKESKRGIPGPMASFAKMSGLIRVFPQSKIFAAYYAGHLSENETHEIEVLSGAFMMVSRKALEKVKGFDEDYFMYAEDIDLSLRIRASGFKNYYLPSTSIIHLKGESTPKHTAFYTRHFYGAMKIFVRKYYAKQPVVKSVMLFAISCSKLLADIKRKC